VWRLTRRRYAEPPSRAFDGIGAARHGQRWNERRRRAAYASATLSLAALEYLCRLTDLEDAPDDLVSVWADVAEADVEAVRLRRIPGWDAFPPEASVRFGTTWAREARSVVLRVPSVVVPSESNFVINPMHPRFARAVRVGSAAQFAFDPRLHGRH